MNSKLAILTIWGLLVPAWSCSSNPQPPDSGGPGPDSAALDQRPGGDLPGGADLPSPGDLTPAPDRPAPDRGADQRPGVDAPQAPDRGPSTDGRPDQTAPPDRSLPPDAACSSSATTWAVAMGGSDLDYAQDVALDSAGNSHLTGYFKGQASFGSTTLSAAGSLDAFVVKVDTAGKVLWAVAASGSSAVEGTDIAVDSAGNVYITGFFNGAVSFGSVTLSTSNTRDIFIAKLNSSGSFLWALPTLGAALDITSAIAVDSAGQAHIASIVTAKVAKDGKRLLWTNYGGGTAFDIAVDGAGNSFVTGSFKGVTIFGSATFTAAGRGDAYVARLDSLGKFKWAAVASGAGPADHAVGYAVARDSGGQLHAAGSYAGAFRFGSTSLKSLGSAGSSDAFVTRLDSSGKFLWAVSAGGTGVDEGVALAAGPGGCVAAGSFTGTASFGGWTLSAHGSKSDIWVARIGSGGGVHWATRAGGSGADSSQGLALDSAGNSLLAGVFSGTAAFGSTSLNSRGGFDVVLARINACGKF